MEVRSCEWESTDDVGDTREILEELYERRAADAGTGEGDAGEIDDGAESWHRTALYGLYRERLEVFEPESNPAVHRLRLTRSLAVSNSRAAMVVLVGLVAVTLPGSELGSLFLYLILLAALLGPDIEPPLSGLGPPIDRRVRPLPGLYAFAAALVAATWVAGTVGRPFGTILAIGIVVRTGAYVLGFDAVPGFPVGRAGSVIRSHMTVLTRTALDLVSVFAFVVAVDGALAALFWYLEVSEYEAAIQSGEIAAVAALELSEASGVRLVLGAAAGFVLVFVAVWTVSLLRGWAGIAGFVRHGRSLTDSGIRHRHTRAVVGVIVASSQVTMFLGAVVAATLLAQVLAGGQLPTGLGTAAVEALVPRYDSPSYSSAEGVLAASDVVLDELPLVPGRTLAVSFLGFGLVPFAALTVGTAYYWGFSALRVRRLVADGRRVPTDDLETAVPVTAVVVDADATFVRPVTAGFGRRRYVLVTESAANALSSDEFDAVILHASRHLASRSRWYHALSLLLGLGGGGRNALLAVRDYARIERVADDYALAHGATPASLLGAIEALWEEKPYDEWPTISSIHPTFVPTPVDDSESGAIRVRALRRPTRLLTAPIKVVRDVYGWYFGSWVVDAVRQPVHTRHVRLFRLSSASSSSSDSEDASASADDEDAPDPPDDGSVDAPDPA